MASETPKSCCHTGKSSDRSQEKDPVCGMKVDPATAAKQDWQGKTYYFCAQSCALKFSLNPQAYLAPKASTGRESAASSTTSSIAANAKETGHAASASANESGSAPGEYTCPMHAEIRQNSPGDCPICGMALTAVGLSPKENQSREVRDTARRLLWSTVFTVPLAAIAMAEMFTMPAALPGAWAPHIAPEHRAMVLNGWLQFVLSLPVLALDRPIFERALLSVKNRSLNMFSLLALGIAIPFLYSLATLISNSSFALGITALASAHSQPMVLYFESAAVISTLVWLGQYLEARSHRQSNSVVRALANLLPDDAIVLAPDDSRHTLAVKDIIAGTRVLIRPGDRIPVDGTVLDGESAVNESMLSGEPMPVYKSTGAAVSAGTLNGNGSLIIKAGRVGGETLLSQIIALVVQAQSSRMPVQKLVDKVAAYFVPAVMAVAAISFCAWLWGGSGSVVALSHAIAVLVVACPCALGLATPMSIVAASGRAAQAGILFKEAGALELLSAIDTLVLDKTGTLTIGKPELTGVESFASIDEDEILALSAAVESHSEHPLSTAITEACQKRGIVPPACRDFQSSPGLGVTGTVTGRTIHAGNAAYMEKCAIVIPPQAEDDCSGPKTGTINAAGMKQSNAQNYEQSHARDNEQSTESNNVPNRLQNRAHDNEQSTESNNVPNCLQNRAHDNEQTTEPNNVPNCEQNHAHDNKQSIEPNNEPDRLQNLPAPDTATTVFLAVDSVCLGRLDFADSIRDDAFDTVKQLQKMGLSLIIASGDNQQATIAVAQKLGISAVHGGLLPADKEALLAKVKEQGKKVAMVGDGINDAPALARADLGIAVACGSDIAVHSADIILVQSDLKAIVRARKLSHAMLGNIKQNLFLAFGYNLIAIPAAAGLLSPIAGFALDPMAAAAAMSLSSLAVIGNALRLRNLKL